jgi:hypothetical protein
MLHPPCSYQELSPGRAVGAGEPSQIFFLIVLYWNIVLDVVVVVVVV